MANVVDILLVAEREPRYAHPGDAGADLCATEAAHLAPGERHSVGTGVSIALPDGYVGLVVPRSGLAIRHGISIVNSPGIIDAGYRGEIRVALWNTDRHEAFQIAAGDRIAQLVIMPFTTAQFHRVDQLPGSERGAGGFGSTGVAAFATATATDPEVLDSPGTRGGAS